MAFAAFISFFPQLVAGPIERSTQLLPQFKKLRKFEYSKAVDGMRQILWGFFKKIVIADNCAMLANNVFDNFESCSAPVLWFGAFMFTFQIYGDFSGYSDIAIGVARLFGINLSRNFHFPYFSRDIAEFWRRWHISLNTWFRDYIYIPLGGSRCSKVKVVRNTMVIFLISGLWHGANWTFVAWGAFHGLLFLPLILSGSNRKYLSVIAENRVFPTAIELFQVLTTFVLVMIGWVIFRSENISQAIDYLIAMTMRWDNPSCGNALVGLNTTISSTILMISILTIIDWTQRRKNFGMQIVEGRSMVVRWSYIFTIFLLYIGLCWTASSIYLFPILRAMRKFILQSALFVLVCLILLICFHLTIQNLRNDYLKLPENVNKVFLGNSTFEYGINDSRIPNAIKFCTKMQSQSI